MNISNWKNKFAWKDFLLSVGIGEGVIFLLSVLCYNNILWCLPLQGFLYPIWKMIQKKREEHRKQQYIQGFRDVLQSMMTSLQAGYSIENACRISLREITELYHSEKNLTVNQLKKIVRGLDFHCSMETLFLQYAEETQVEEIYEFAVVLNIAKTTGGNVVEILKTSMEHLQSKMDAAEEWKVSLSGRIFEKNIMLLMPFGILFYLRLANGEYVESLYKTIPGNILMTGIILVILGCFFWTEKIMEIEF